MKTYLSIDPHGQADIQHLAVRQGGVTPDRTISSTDLFGGRREIGIEHHGAYYRLKITRQGKLILNK
ncbi:hemin uptake protein HemP [Nitratireductor kimnyeongensis]|uniref:Hemin uptake protein HemP n=1 Tax=Nitratireductor kimnyeongensis TaxID=430679 RepID=A0ABW0T2R9_9HYPH|nr:hemin uptake protein HemP [Nitratireductor kimnyeongensis]QZZ35358.1 hemin uptake protein HemP [Nitratireductor kimnyeongensis]